MSTAGLAVAAETRPALPTPPSCLLERGHGLDNPFGIFLSRLEQCGHLVLGQPINLAAGQVVYGGLDQNLVAGRQLAVTGLIRKRSLTACQTFCSMAKGTSAAPLALGWSCMDVRTAGKMGASKGGMLRSRTRLFPWTWLDTAETAPQLVCPSTTSMGVCTWARPYSMEPASSVLTTLPTTRTTKRFHDAAVENDLHRHSESEQESTVAKA